MRKLVKLLHIIILKYEIMVTCVSLMISQLHIAVIRCNNYPTIFLYSPQFNADITIVYFYSTAFKLLLSNFIFGHFFTYRVLLVV